MVSKVSPEYMLSSIDIDEIKINFSIFQVFANVVTCIITMAAHFMQMDTVYSCERTINHVQHQLIVITVVV